MCDVTSVLRCICDQRSPPGPVPIRSFLHAQRGGGQGLRSFLHAQQGGGRGLPAGGDQAASASGSGPHTISVTVCGLFSAASSLCLCCLQCVLLTAPQSPVKCRPGLGETLHQVSLARAPVTEQLAGAQGGPAAQTLSKCLQTETLAEQSDSFIIGWKRGTGSWQEPNPVFALRARAQGSPIGIGVTS